METLLWVSLSYGTYGLVIENDQVKEAPPIARWMVGKSFNKVILPWLRRRGAKIKTAY